MIYEPVVKWLEKKVGESGAKGLVFGLSGGIDSAVIAGLAKKAFPENSLGIIMPCESLEQDEIDARIVSDALNLEVEKVDLTSTYRTMIKDSFISDNKLAKSNIKPRLRMTTLYYYAQDKNYLVCGSSNASEFYIGYYTKNGDSGVDILPIATFLKEEVFELAKELNIPKIIIDKKPSAGLWENQTDESEMGFTYRELDNYIKGLKIDENVAKRIERMHKASAHKRKFAEIYKRD